MGNEQDNLRCQFEGLVLQQHVQLRAFVRSLGVDRDWVDDIAQEAFLTAYRQWDSFDQSRDFGKWVRGIAANIVRNEIRKDARRQRILYEELAEILVRREVMIPEGATPLSIELVRDCVERLAPRSQQIVAGKYRDGLAAGELAHRMQMTAANVRQVLVRIRRQIKECVEVKRLGEV